MTMMRADETSMASIDETHAKRNALMDALEQAGIATRQGTHAVHTLGHYREKYGYRAEERMGAYACDRLSLALPLYAGMTDDEQDYVIEKLQELHAKE